MAGKIDIGSMGDYPMLINGSSSRSTLTDNRTEMVSVTGYNLRGALNMRRGARNSSTATHVAEARRPEGLHQRRLGRATAPWSRRLPRRRSNPSSGVKVNQRPVGRRVRPAGRQRGRAGAVRGLARPAGLPGPGQAALRRRPTGRADPARRRRPARLRPARPGRGQAFLQAQIAGDRLPARSTRWPRPSRSPRQPGCRRRSSTSTTVRTAWPPSTRRSSRSCAPRCAATCRS